MADKIEGHPTAVDEHLTEPQVRALLSAILGATPLVIYAKDSDHKFIFTNEQHRSLLGLPARTILGQTDTDLFGDEASPVEEVTRQVLQTGVSKAQEFELTLNGQLHTFLETIYPLRGEQRVAAGVAGIAADITTRRALEKALQHQNEELLAAVAHVEQTQHILIQQQKLAALGELVAGVAHEVSTPLHVGLTGATLVMDITRELQSSAQAKTLTLSQLQQHTAQLLESASLMHNSLRQAARLIQSIKQVAAERQVQEVRRVKLREWLEVFTRSLDLLTRRAGVQLTVQVDDLPTVDLATGPLEQIITNLVMNALTHAFPTGTPEPRIVLSLTRDDGDLRLVVSDNGTGVTPETAKRIFEPFYTTRRGEGGTGLGLHISWSLATGAFEGDLLLVDTQEPGARFELRLPIGTKNLAWASEGATTAGPHPGA
jgi:PAS domain S-box-containing protein